MSAAPDAFDVFALTPQIPAQRASEPSPLPSAPEEVGRGEVLATAFVVFGMLVLGLLVVLAAAGVMVG